MVQKTSPFLGVKYGWEFGESGWNFGMDENLLKFSFLFDSNIDGIVSELPPPVNGVAYFNTVDKMVYYTVDGSYTALSLPKWFALTLKSTGESFQFDGTDIQPIPSVGELDTRVDGVEEELSTLGTAAFAEVSDFATPANLGIVEANSQSYTDSKFTDLANGNGEMVGYLSPLTTAVARNIHNKLAEFVSVKDFGAVGDGIADDTAAIQACIDAVGALMDGVVFFPTGKYRITTSLNLTNGNVSLKGSSSNRNDSVIIGDTGENFAIDMTGSDNRWTSIEDLYLVSDASQANPTVNGLLLARTVAASLAGESYFKNFRINLISAPTANN